MDFFHFLCKKENVTKYVNEHKCELIMMGSLKDLYVYMFD
jgi:hypothetical protein